MCRQIGGGDVYQCVFVPGEQVYLARDRLNYLRAEGLFVSFKSHENTLTPLWPLYSHRFSMKRCRKQCHVWVTSLSIVLGIMIVEIILVFTRWNLCALGIKTWNALWKRSVLECNESSTCSVLQTWHTCAFYNNVILKVLLYNLNHYVLADFKENVCLFWCI